MEGHFGHRIGFPKSSALIRRTASTAYSGRWRDLRSGNQAKDDGSDGQNGAGLLT